MSYLNWSLLTGALASGIVAAVLYVKLKLAEERLGNARAELASSWAKCEELSAALAVAKVDLRSAQKAAISVYETLQKSLSGTTGPAAVAGMREIFAAKDSGSAAKPVPAPAKAKP